MTKEDLIKYTSLEEEIIEQTYRLFVIALKEYPEQFGTFIKDGSHFHEIEIDDEQVTFSFEEGRGDWFEKYHFRMSIETFLDENLFRQEQQEEKRKYEERVAARKKRTEQEKEDADLALLEELKKKYKK